VVVAGGVVVGGAEVEEVETVVVTVVEGVQAATRISTRIGFHCLNRRQTTAGRPCR
jgi:hypothetical protein